MIGFRVTEFFFVLFFGGKKGSASKQNDGTLNHNPEEEPLGVAVSPQPLSGLCFVTCQVVFASQGNK